ncbi:rhamnogalacturonan acetylesterase [Phocaeicola vulgatus]|uniref:rhamnogalacturonan acetylesterase n=1 Tax=Phocaeicola vulgatus TaxID=821 RepID=UPI0034A5A4D0
MKQIALLALGLLATLGVEAQTYKFDFTTGKKTKDGYTKITPADRYSEEKGYGYDRQPSPEGKSTAPFFFSVTVPDGNYHVTAVIGNKRAAGETTVRGESRRLFFENVKTKKGELKSCTFVINKRNTHISEKENVRIKPRERQKLNWDDKLTLEFNGDAPQLSELIIEKVNNVPTVFLCGNSTVVDQDNEPWASWGQMIPRFFNDSICFANYAESGESANTFIGAGRLKKALTQMKPGDYIFMEFGHNDQKQKGPGKGAYYSFMTSLKTFIDEARARGVYPVLVTPTQRRSFDENGKIRDTHEDYPEAMRWLAAKENVPLIDLNEMTRTLYEAMGVEPSKKAFVHYPAGTYPGQNRVLADNTHFNPYGAYQISKCIIEGIKKAGLPIANYLRSDYSGYNPAHPDALDSFKWNDSPFTEIEKPDGN